jgi:ABC-type glycerol-3-phosphate transport system substrate-binding protein
MTVNNGPKGLVTTIKDQFEWDVMPTPRWAGTKKRVTGNNNQQGHIVLKTAEQRGHVDAATQFAMWMAGEGGQAIVARTGGATPVHKKTAYGPLYIDGSPPGLKLQLDLLTKKADQDYRGFRIIKYFAQWYAAVSPILDKGFDGEISVSEMATQATRAGNAVLDSLK